MSRRVNMKITMELLSDAIFGSGYSIPGGEDIAVCQDSEGYPYLKGSTLKGLLKESMENLADWMGKGQEAIISMLGSEHWTGVEEERRIHVSSLKLDNPPMDATNCYMLRSFTSLENGIAKEGTLRTASCICRGQVFCGEIDCMQEDVPFIQQALAGIKWVGTMRSKGFGNVCIKGETVALKTQQVNIERANCIHYRLHAELPIFITDLNRSNSYHYQTRGYIPGSAVRGMVISEIASRIPEWFATHKVELLSDKTRFLDAVPNPCQKVVLPSIKGFYEKKDGSAFQSVIKDGNLTPGVKRAGIGSFCSIEKGIIHYWNAETEGVTRINRNKQENQDTLMFQNRYICEGQDFDGYIMLDRPRLAVEITKALSDVIWLGADRYEGFGKCKVTLVEEAEEPAWLNAYGDHNPGKILYMLAISPFSMVGGMGEPCGLDEEQLAKILGVDTVQVQFCSTSISEYRSYNRTWQCFSPSVRMYDSGSIFKLSCSEIPKVENMRQLQLRGLGIHLAEGYGQIIFLNPELYETISGKEAFEKDGVAQENTAALIRRAKLTWVMETAKQDWCGKLSKSQIGTIQALCERAILQNGDQSELEGFFEKNTKKRGASHADKFKEVNDFMEPFLKQPLTEILQVPYEDNPVEHLKLLCQLFDYSRKGTGREEE